MDILIKRIARK
jgi:hypothetical protein